jgi:hypothetical protein
MQLYHNNAIRLSIKNCELDEHRVALFQFIFERAHNFGENQLKIVTLDFSQNPFSDAGLDNLLKVFQRNSSKK